MFFILTNKLEFQIYCFYLRRNIKVNFTDIKLTKAMQVCAMFLYAKVVECCVCICVTLCYHYLGQQKSWNSDKVTESLYIIFGYLDFIANQIIKILNLYAFVHI